MKMRNAEKILGILEAQGYSFSFLSKDDVLKHKEFVERNWPGAVTRSDYQYNSWKYGKRDKSINLLVCKKDGNIIGQIGYVSARVSIRGSEHDCAWGCNFKVDEGYRDIGIGAALELYAATHFSIILGNTPSDPSIKYKKAIGYKFLDGPVTMMLPLRADHVLQLKTPPALQHLIPAVSALVTPIIKLLNRARLQNNSSGKWLAASAKHIAARIARKEQGLALPHIIHDNRFLEWRCKPPEGIRTSPEMLVYDGDDVSFAIFSISGKVLNIYDFMFGDADVAKSFIKELCKDKTASTIKILANDENEVALFRKLGFIAFRTRAVITAYSRERYFDREHAMHVTLYDGDGDI
jgi:hypothetical protein